MNGPSRLIFFLLYLFCGQFHNVAIGQQFEGDSCVDSYTYSVGKCRKLELCDSAKRDLEQRGIRPKTCSYTVNSLLVCCKDVDNYNNVQQQQPTSQNNNNFNNFQQTTKQPNFLAILSKLTTVKPTENFNQMLARPSSANNRPPQQVFPVYRPTPVNTNSGGESFITTGQNYKGRVSERKCQEYSNQVYQTVNFISLDIDPVSQAIKSTKCHFIGTELIVGGEDAKLGEFPHMAAIGWAKFDNDYTFDCGGSLISKRFVLTAAHCSYSASTDISNPEPVIVRLGDQNIDPSVDDNATPIEVGIKRIIKHPDYKSPVTYNDIALLELDFDVKFNLNIRPACLWTQRDFGYHQKVIATGWGIINPKTRQRAKELQKVSLSIYKNKECDEELESLVNRNWEFGFTDTQMCAGELRGGKDTCPGDSGSPLQIVSDQNKCVFNLVGITSQGARTCGTIPAVYTRIDRFLDWIESVVWPGE